MHDLRTSFVRATPVRLPRRRFMALAAGAVGAFSLPVLSPGDMARAQETSTDPTLQGAIQPVEAAPRGALYFAETGHNLAEPFRSRWEAAGGQAVIGMPLSEERFIAGTGGVTQSFQNLTLLFDPGQEAPLNVRGQILGKSAWAEIIPAAAAQPVAGCSTASCQIFTETGHSLDEPFASFWNGYGGAPIFGPPISQPFADPAGSGSMMQVFENAVLESTGGVVSLRPMGKLLAERDGLMADLAFQPAPPTGGNTFLVSAGDGLTLRGGPSPDAAPVAVLPDSTEFIAAADAAGDWAPGYAEGLSGWVSAGFLAVRPPLPQLQVADWDLSVWQGAALEETNVRSQPFTTSPELETLAYGDAVTVTAWVKGEEVFEGSDMWAQIGENRFVFSRNIGRAAPVLPTPVPAEAPVWDRWININLTQQLLTTYNAAEPERTILVTTGMAGWETPTGTFTILNKVANETMTSGAIGAENFYRLDDVLFTQYFTDFGHALHFAWWRTKETIGRPGSHGCINLLLEDSRYLWDWADYGTPIVISY